MSNPFVLAKTWKNGMSINPNINNMRVAYCNDPSMITANVSMWPSNSASDALAPFTDQNSKVDTAKVSTNMDKMAMTLAHTATAGGVGKDLHETSEQAMERGTCGHEGQQDLDE